LSKTEKISVIDSVYKNKIKISGSVFLGYASPAESLSEALKILENIKREHFTATHNCFAIKTRTGMIKYSDDGEPNGTAGIRIFNSIESYGLSDIIVVVTRFFGGTKLGVGPLGKAYSDTSADLLKEAKIIELTRFREIKISYRYEDTSAVHYLLSKYNCQKISNLFESSPLISAAVQPNMIESFRDELVEKTAGKAQLKSLNKDIYLNLK
jgi:uncharacterized YigZ family protein